MHQQIPSTSSQIPKLIIRLITVMCLVSGIIGLVFWQVYRIDPYFSRTSIVAPYQTSINSSNKITLIEKSKTQLKNNYFIRMYGLLRAGLRIPLYSLTTAEKPLTGPEESIIDQIHALRFNPDKPYVITGSHYSDLYMRNMGIFFNALLDPRLPTSETDWQNRQRIALQTIAYDLEFLSQNGSAVTTIIPLGDHQFTGVNIYTAPSDSLYAVVYSLRALTDNSFVTNRFSSPVATPAAQFNLQSDEAARQLLDHHRGGLTTALNHYLESSLDSETGLIRSDISLSSARDGVKRSSSFYDNVIAWSTVQMADELGIPHSPTLDTETWKQAIISAYWDETAGIFNDELTLETTAVPTPVFSADSLIVTSSGFFNLQLESDRFKLVRIIDYIQTHELDQPFPLRYSRVNNKDQMRWTVKTFAPSYMGDGIWSHWGMEYIKALVMLSEAKPELAAVASQHLARYKHNIETFGGYPELYASDGSLFRSPLVHGVLHTGWVVNYEQAKMMAGIK